MDVDEVKEQKKPEEEEELFVKAKLPQYHMTPGDNRHCVEFDMMYINHQRTTYVGMLTKCQAILSDKEKNPDMWLKLNGHGFYLITSVDDIKHILTSMQLKLIDNPFLDYPKVPVNPRAKKIKEDKDKEMLC